MLISGQRLGFNPKDHDGVFTGLDDHITDVSGVRPNADHASFTPPAESPFPPWNIYPKPPPPHWQLKPDDVAEPSQISAPGGDDFEFGKCEIPGAHEWEYEMDEKGVFQVYDKVEGDILFNMQPLVS